MWRLRQLVFRTAPCLKACLIACLATCVALGAVAPLRGQGGPGDCGLPVSKRYSDILDLEALGDREGALSYLVELFACAWETKGGVRNELDQTVRDWNDAVAEVCSKGCLVPIISLHSDLEVDLAVRGRETARRRAKGYMEDTLRKHLESVARAEERDELTALVYARIGLALRDRTILEEAREYLLKAVKLAPDDPSYLHALGTLDERLGTYGPAHDQFEKLLKLDPRDSTARLRLGLLSWRLSRKKEAREHLETLVREGTPPWVQELAYQELAQLHLEEGETEEAAELVRQGLEAFPQSQALGLQLAYLKSKTREDPIAVLANIALNPPPGSPRYLDDRTPRVIYNQWPENELAPLEESWKKRLEESRKALSGALSTLRLRDRQ